MSEKERENFVKAAVSRAPGKRLVKPSQALFEGAFDGIDLMDDEDDGDFSTGQLATGDDHSDGSDDEDSDGSGGIDENSSTGGYESGSEKEDGESEMANQKKIDDHSPVQVVCSVCLDYRRPEGLGELIQCDKCGLTVHEACYGSIIDQPATDSTNSNHAMDAQSMSSSASTEPWFCEQCLLGNGTVPHCELCPNRFGAFKRGELSGTWAHLICALFTPGISFSDIDRLSGVSWQDIDYRNFGRKPCAGCADKLESRTGITVRCDAGLCKNYYHVTCAQKLGLLVENVQHNASGMMETGYIYCKHHNHNEEAMNRQKTAYANFTRQEDRRVVDYRNVHLDVRQEKKWQAQLNERLKHIEALQTNDIATTSAIQPKKAKYLHTSPRYMNAFAEKAELLGMTRQHFEQEFASVPPSQLPSGLPPAFSKNFVGYVEHRDIICIQEEKVELEKSTKHKDQLLQNQKDLEKELQMVQSKHNGLVERVEAQRKLTERFKSVMKLFSPNSFDNQQQVKKKIVVVNRKRSMPKATTSAANKFPNEVAEKRDKADVNANQKTQTGAEQKPLKLTPIKLANTKETLSFNEKVASGTYLLGPQNISTSLFSKFGFNDKPPPPEFVPTPGVQSPTKTQPKILKKSSAKLKSSGPHIPKNGLPINGELPSSPQQPKVCNKCKQSNDAHLLIYCETCKFYYHAGCLDPPLDRPPSKNKFTRFECSDCAFPSEDEQKEMEDEPDGTTSDWALTASRTRRQLRAKTQDKID